MTGLPSGWSTAKLSDVAQWASGGTPQAGNSEYYGGGIPWAIIGDLNGGVDRETKSSITEAGLNNSSAKIVPAGTVLLAMYGSIGKLGIAGKAMATNQAIATAMARDSVDPKYLFYFLMSQRELFDAAGKGATQRNISQTILRPWKIPLPAFLTDQRRIVEILEDHLSRLDAAERLLQAQVLRLRALRSATIRAGLAGQQAEVPLREVLSVSVGGLWGTEPGGDEVDVRVLRVTELKRHGRLDPSTAARRSVAIRQLEPRMLQVGDLLLEKSGGGPNQPVGRVGLVEQLDDVSICANFMQLMRPDPSRVDPRYLHLFLNDFYERGGTVPLQKASTNIRNLKASEYVLMPIPLPSLDRQRQVVSELELLLEQYATLERTLLSAVDRGQGLRRSLLAAAFSGELTRPHTRDELVEEFSQ